MEEWIATFFSHFGAISFKRKCGKEGINAKIMPVPRSLSSSCGTCVKFDGAEQALTWESEELEQIVKIVGEGEYQVLYFAEDA